MRRILMTTASASSSSSADGAKSPALVTACEVAGAAASTSARDGRSLLREPLRYRGCDAGSRQQIGKEKGREESMVRRSCRTRVAGRYGYTFCIHRSPA